MSRETIDSKAHRYVVQVAYRTLPRGACRKPERRSRAFEARTRPPGRAPPA
jgi:hypothetical protein